MAIAKILPLLKGNNNESWTLVGAVQTMLTTPEDSEIDFPSHLNTMVNRRTGMIHHSTQAWSCYDIKRVLFLGRGLFAIVNRCV